MRIQIILLLVVCLMAATASLAQQSNPNCVFLGCSCGDDADKTIENSQEDLNGDIDAATADQVPANQVSYEISTCRPRDDPEARLTEFPMRDTSRKYSNQIASLELNDNDIETVPGGQFAGLEVILLDLSANNIRQIDENAFAAILKLEILDLSNNQLRNLDDRTLQPVEATLVQLKLSSNHLNQMDIGKLGALLSKLNRLTFLGLRHNHLERVPDLSAMPRLEELSLESNLLQSLGEESGKSLLPSTLVDLKLENNKIQEITERTFANLKSLKYLNLGSNQISSISERAFAHMTKLTSLILKKNNIKHIPGRLVYSLINLDRLDLSAQNQFLKSVDDYAFDRQSNHHSIRKIDLSNNRITSIGSRAFCSRNQSHPYANIKEIDLAANPLQSLNACVMRQLAKGYTTHHVTHARTKVSFKSTGSHLPDSPAIKCDCEITKAAGYVDFEGDCESGDGTLVNMKSYKCSNDAARNHDSVEIACFSAEEFDCKKHAHHPHHQHDNNNNDPTKNNNMNDPSSQQTTMQDGGKGSTGGGKSQGNKGPSAIGSDANTINKRTQLSFTKLCSLVIFSSIAGLFV